MPTRNSRTRVVAQLLRELEGVHPERRAIIAVDGVDGAGKSHLAQELSDIAAAQQSRPLVCVSIDGFHRPRAERISAGLGAEGFYRGSYRYDEFRAHVVDPLRTDGVIIPAVWDVARDEPVEAKPLVVPARGLVLVDGIFLQRPELNDVWDAVVWVHAPFHVSVPRGNARFSGRFDADPEAPSNARYVGGQRLYFAESYPADRATWAFDNTDLDAPTLRHNFSSR